MNIIIFIIFAFLTGIGVFMIGMRIMGKGLIKSAEVLKKLFNKTSNNSLLSVAIGAGVTGIIQSSTATTVIVIGLVNAGTMTLFQATAIIMGANIGTTITALIVALSSLPSANIASILALVGVLILAFAKSKRANAIGEIVSGLGLVFVGLTIMSNALNNESIKGAFESAFSLIESPLPLIIFGIAFSALVQSSSAVNGLIITMASIGSISVESCLYIVLGTNVGSCVTTMIASIGTDLNARRAAVIHLLFNIIGSIIFAFILLFLSKYVIMMLSVLSPNYYGMQIAWFHILLNIICTIIMLPFIKQLTLLSQLLVPNKKAHHKKAKRAKNHQF